MGFSFLATSDDRQIRSFVVFFFRSILSYNKKAKRKKSVDVRALNSNFVVSCMINTLRSKAKHRQIAFEKWSGRGSSEDNKNKLHSISWTKCTQKYGTIFGTEAFEKWSKKNVRWWKETPEKKCCGLEKWKSNHLFFDHIILHISLK